MMPRSNDLASARGSLFGLLGLVCVGCLEIGASAPGTATMIDPGTDAGLPSEFDLQGRWTVVRDPTAKNGLALQYSGVPEPEDKFPLAIYKPGFLKNAQISLRLKAEAGQSDRSGGVAVRLRSPQDYYLIQMDARREETIFSRMKDGVSEEIADVDAEITSHGWHTLTVRVVDNEFTVSFDGKWAFTGFDRVFSQPGNVALWTKGDSVFRFDDINIRTLAADEESN
jgi:hypothetical protein